MDDLSPQKPSLMTREWAIAAVAVNVCILALGLRSDSPNYYAGVQAFLLLETGGVLVWYTIETAAIRSVGQRQLEISQRQLEAAKEQINIAEHGRLQAEQELRRSLAPNFVTHEIVTRDGTLVVQLTNQGSPVTDLSVRIRDDSHMCRIGPPTVPKLGRARIDIFGVADSTSELYFTVDYLDVHQHPGAVIFHWKREGNALERALAAC